MKRVIKAVFRPFWGLLVPIRRKANARLHEAVRTAVQASLPAAHVVHVPSASTDELLLALDNLVTEVYRLQSRVEELTQAIHEKDAAPRWSEAGV